MRNTTSDLHEQELPYCDALDLYRRLRHFALPVWLASGQDNGTDGSVDILSAAPARLLSTEGTRTRVRHASGAEELTEEHPLEVLRRHVGAEAGAPLAHGQPFAGGAIGWFAYDLLHPWYRIATGAEDDIGLPGMLVGVYQWAVVVDHVARSCHFLARPSCPPALREEVLGCLTAPPPRPAAGFKLREPFRSNFTQEEYRRVCQRIIDYIHAGDCYQTNLAQRFSASFEGDPLDAFAHLHALANAPFSAYMESPEGAVLSFSPERFLQVRGGVVRTEPIKGTRPRSADPERDQALLRELQDSAKDRAENLMIVDLLRNDLGRVCETGSVTVPGLFEARSFRNVHHLVSTVEGRLGDPGQVYDLLRASFPGGSITGAPKLRAMQIINELETRPRSVYCGAIGYIGFEGDMDSNICIRTLVAARGRIHCWGGGGIVADSDPGQEYQETLDKIALFLGNLAGRNP